MRLAKISSSNIVKDDNNRKEPRENAKPVKGVEVEGKDLLSELNVLLEKHHLPFNIVEIDNEYYFIDKVSREILGELSKSHINELMDTAKLVSAEVERNLAYDQQAPSGNFLNLEV